MDQSVASSASHDEDRNSPRHIAARSMSVSSDTHECDEHMLDNADSKAEKNRERNREHAKRTRLRKKEMIEGMKVRLLELQRESSRLEQLLEESNTANILLCLGVKPEDKQIVRSESQNRLVSDGDSAVSVPKGNIIDQLRHKVRVEAARTLKTKYPPLSPDASAQDQTALFSQQDAAGGAGSGSSEAGGEPEGDNSMMGEPYSSSWVSGVQENQKRERNRLHAKLTRDRKKMFTHKMQQTIQTLERHNHSMRARLQSLIYSQGRDGAAIQQSAGASNVGEGGGVLGVGLAGAPAASHSIPPGTPFIAYHPGMLFPPPQGHSYGLYPMQFYAHPHFQLLPHLGAQPLLPTTGTSAIARSSGVGALMAAGDSHSNNFATRPPA
eukprot:gene24606-29727_t